MHNGVWIDEVYPLTGHLVYMTGTVLNAFKLFFPNFVTPLLHNGHLGQEMPRTGLPF